ncbi:MAG: M24 family metallopeptidase [Solirubrobacterales bacterium]|nr:M24 family metallopeptidase [Solirubrobacterales bacterium]
MTEQEWTPTDAEIERRHDAIRTAAERAGLDAVLVCGSEYTGFEGAVTYASGFRILHRYAYVLVPVEGEPVSVYPQEARWVGDHGETFVSERVFAPTPGAWLRDRFREGGLSRVGVYGLDHAMPVRDYRELADGPAELVRFDEEFDLARAVKSEEELRSVRHSMEINRAGVFAVSEAYEPGRTEAELMGAAEEVFAARGTARLTMDMVLTGPHGAVTPEMTFPSATRRVADTDLLIYGLEVAGPGGHWVEFSRPLAPGGVSDETARMMEAYGEHYEIAGRLLKEGSTAEQVHRAASQPFVERGYRLGHVTGHSIGMTMIELPRIGEGTEVTLRENMVFSMHPHVISEDERTCLYFQETWRVGATEGEALSGVPPRLFDGSETLAGVTGGG